MIHQIFEGLALGTRIATIGADIDSAPMSIPLESSGLGKDPRRPSDSVGTNDDVALATGLSMKKKLGLGALSSFITPAGMVIGLLVLKHFNGNSPGTIIAIGTLDALSAGILIWVGIVEMWAGDWMVGSHGHGAELAEADLVTILIASIGLLGGMILMSILGKGA